MNDGILSDADELHLTRPRSPPPSPDDDQAAVALMALYQLAIGGTPSSSAPSVDEALAVIGSELLDLRAVCDGLMKRNALVERALENAEHRATKAEALVQVQLNSLAETWPIERVWFQSGNTSAVVWGTRDYGWFSACADRSAAIEHTPSFSGAFLRAAGLIAAHVPDPVVADSSQEPL